MEFSTDPAAVDNNNFFGCNGLYRDENTTTLTIANINAMLGTGNVDDDSLFCTGFICGGKWRFSGTTSDTVKTGGKNGIILGWGFNDDFTGALRSATGGCAMGATCPAPTVCTAVFL